MVINCRLLATITPLVKLKYHCFYNNTATYTYQVVRSQTMLQALLLIGMLITINNQLSIGYASYLCRNILVYGQANEIRDSNIDFGGILQNIQWGMFGLKKLRVSSEASGQFLPPSRSSE